MLTMRKLSTESYTCTGPGGPIISSPQGPTGNLEFPIWESPYRSSSDGTRLIADFRLRSRLCTRTEQHLRRSMPRSKLAVRRVCPTAQSSAVSSRSRQKSCFGRLARTGWRPRSLGNRSRLRSEFTRQALGQGCPEYPVSQRLSHMSPSSRLAIAPDLYCPAAPHRSGRPATSRARALFRGTSLRRSAQRPSPRPRTHRGYAAAQP